MKARTSLLLIGKIALLIGALGVTYGITAYAGLQLSLKSFYTILVFVLF